VYIAYKLLGGGAVNVGPDFAEPDILENQIGGPVVAGSDNEVYSNVNQSINQSINQSEKYLTCPE